MSALWKVALVAATTLGALAAVVFGARDGSVFVSPPEAVVEQFLRELQTDRYERARPYLATEAEARLDPDSLEAWTATLEARLGKISEVTGVAGWRSAGWAEAGGRVRGETGRELVLRFPLVRERGVWEISRLEDPSAGFTEAGP